MPPPPPPAHRGSQLLGTAGMKALSAPPLARPGKPKPLPEGKLQATRGDFADLRGRLILASVLMVSTFLIGVFGYHAIDPAAPWVDAVYMTANAITTAGFREAIDVSGFGGKVFTIFLLVFGAGTVVYFTSVMTAFVVEGDLTQSFRRRRMLRTVQQMSDHFIVCGAGNAGLSVLAELAATRRPTVVIEADPARAKRVEEHFRRAPGPAGDSTTEKWRFGSAIAAARGTARSPCEDKDSSSATVT